MSKKTGVICLLLAIFMPPSVGLSQQSVRWEPTLESAQRVAGQSNRLVLIEFWAPWCSVCKRMEAEVLSQPSVASVLNSKYVSVKINADNFPATARRYGITALPTTVITTPDGQQVDAIRGRLDTADFIAHINRVAADAERRFAAQNTPPAAVATAPATNRSSSPAANVTPRYNSYQPNQVAAAQPNAQNLPAPPNTEPRMYIPPTDYDPSRNPTPPQNNLPPQTASATVPPTQTYPPANSVPSNVQPPRYTNPPTRFGQAPGQAPAAPAYGYQVPPAVAAQPPVAQNMPAPTMPSQPNVAPNQPAPAVNNPPLGLDGYSPVALCEKQQWVPGDSRWGAIHRGRTYLFASPDEQRRFFTDPDRYAPVGSGNDVVLAAEQGKAVPGKREHGVFYGQRIFLFSSEESLARFYQKPDVYASQVLNAARSGAAAGSQLH